MNSNTKLVIRIRNRSENDDQFIEQIEALTEKEGKGTYASVLHVFTGLAYSPEEAEKEWSEILKHRLTLSLSLDRKINLITAISDYSSSVKNSLKFPKLIEIDAYEQVIRESTHDGLTGLLNKTFFKNTLKQQVSLAERYDTHLSVLFLDIDNFKDVNDTYGHPFGDIILKNIAEILTETVRSSDIAARYGGEEFIILMPQTNHLNALIMGERIRQKIESTLMVSGHQSCRITVSGGLSSFPTDTRQAADMINLADRALYRAKGAGKNNISLYREDKRRFLRIKFTRSIKVRELGFDPTTTQSGQSKDMSIGGILFQNREPLPIGTRVQVSIPMNHEETPVVLIGTIVRVESFGSGLFDIGMLLSIKEMEKTATDEISKFLINQTTSSFSDKHSKKP